MGTTIAITLFLMLLVCLAWVVVEIGKWNARKAINEEDYNEKYNLIQKYLQHDPDAYMYRIISNQVELLENMPHKNKERTDVLKSRFNRRYEAVRQQINLKTANQ